MTYCRLLYVAMHTCYYSRYTVYKYLFSRKGTHSILKKREGVYLLAPADALGTPYHHSWGFLGSCNFGHPKAWPTMWSPQVGSQNPVDPKFVLFRQYAYFGWIPSKRMLLWIHCCFGQRLTNNHTWQLVQSPPNICEFPTPLLWEKKSRPFLAASPAVVVRFGPPAHPKSSRAAAHPRFPMAWPEFSCTKS